MEKEEIELIPAPLYFGWMSDIWRLPAQRKVSQKERRKKARYRRSQGIKRRTK